MGDLPTVAEVEALPLRAFARGDLVLHVDAAVLGERVLFVPDGYGPAPDEPIAYRARELAALIGVDPAVVRLAHAAKRAFPGARVAGTERLDKE
jgi:hypothetical protein